jgi:hypothetical protein
MTTTYKQLSNGVPYTPGFLDANVTTRNIGQEFEGNDDSFGLWVVFLLQPAGIITLNAAVSVLW